ncbi:MULTISPECIES: SDR family oxidoreductase [unclassified Streptomyces]|uniref:SDR family oxidoreductase n=1 Tax=unclassified Streptomyces TaxID=2593676 RepID=UPI0037FDC929
MTRYAGQRAVVLCRDTSIGLAIAKRLVEGGAEVRLGAGTPAERARARTELGSGARVTDGTAGVGTVGGLCATGDSEAADLLFTDAVSLVSPLPAWLRDGGAVVVTDPTSSAAAVRALAAEGASRHIRVNAVAPGCIEAAPTAPSPPASPPTEAPSPSPSASPSTPSSPSAPPSRSVSPPLSVAPSLPPLGRLGSAEEVARAALFLATEATFTTGARLPVDGGRETTARDTTARDTTARTGA